MQDEEFRQHVREWLAEHLPAELVDVGGPGREHEAFDERLAWERTLAAANWTCLGWPAVLGGRDLPLSQQVIFHEEYALAGGPARVNVVGEGLLAPTLIAFGTPDQKDRFLPGIKSAQELWCQGYSEPGAGSDLARSRPKRCSTATSGSSPVRRPGPRSRTSPTGASCWPVPSPDRHAITGFPICSCRCASRGSPFGRSHS
jgi:alkylation response protein AidB-like acyl-CoA dehydrogenase